MELGTEKIPTVEKSRMCMYVYVEGVLEGVSRRRALQREGERAKALGREGGNEAVSSKKGDLKSISWPRRITLARMKYNVK